VIKLYLENWGIRAIERLTGIHNSQISSWIEDGARYIQNELEKSSNINESLKEYPNNGNRVERWSQMLREKKRKDKGKIWIN
jgi:hypothetical protein